ncbi:Nitric oxide reductase activation protein NorE [Rubellimicrobium mesophilum DSM 19309]|uniref:Nitric oxide reductase activation protein NorE n=1 Tax=Rubellimicrobium mesophilum DSM 19309 TaxID=442562 RepID=A0A017HQJ1_9RHOB|nr:Nitric oxide reductase activation protein NorE [Rubellimicrobium mesophilum DSM 19309]
MTTQDHAPPRSVLEDLPGDLLIWVLIVSELAVFGAGLLAFLVVRLGDPSGFAAAQDQLHRVSASINTVVLVTSGWLAARATREAQAGRVGPTRLNLALAGLLGIVFLVLKGREYADAIARGLGTPRRTPSSPSTGCSPASTRPTSSPGSSSWPWSRSVPAPIRSRTGRSSGTWWTSSG